MTAVTHTPAADAISTNDTLINGLIIGGFIIALLVLVSIYYWVEKVRGTGRKREHVNCHQDNS
jgi:hypothetical protein